MFRHVCLSYLNSSPYLNWIFLQITPSKWSSGFQKILCTFTILRRGSLTPSVSGPKLLTMVPLQLVKWLQDLRMVPLGDPETFNSLRHFLPLGFLGSMGTQGRVPFLDITLNLDPKVCFFKFYFYLRYGK